MVIPMPDIDDFEVLLSAVAKVLCDSNNKRLTTDQILHKLQIDGDRRSINAALRKLRDQGHSAVDSKNQWRLTDSGLKTFQPISKKNSGGSTPISRKLKPEFPIESFQKYRTDIVAALGSEIEVLKKTRDKASAALTAGRLVNEVSGSYVYRFSLESPFAAMDDSPAQVQIGKKTLDCQIISIDGLEIDISLKEHLGTFVPDARILSNSWQLLHLLKTKFEDDELSSESFLLSDSAFAGEQSTTPTTSIKPAHGLNESQLRAIQHSLGNSLAIIWGPPGTGKTKTIAAAVAAHLAQGRRVLLVSHANAAVDEAMYRVGERLQDNSPLFTNGQLVRVGICRKDLEAAYPEVVLSKIVERRGKAIAAERDNLNQEKQSIAKQQSGLRRIVRLKEQKENTTANISKAAAHGQWLASESARLSSLLNDSENLLNERHRLLNETNAQKGIGGAFFKFVRGLDPIRIAEEISQMESIHQKRQVELDEVSTRQALSREELSELEDDLIRLEREFSEQLSLLQISADEVSTQTSKAKQRTREIDERLKDIEQLLEQLEREVTKDARLIATTLTKTFCSSLVSKESFDVVILDEASMAPLPHVYWALHLATENATIVGDFLQLPPIPASSDSESSQRWLNLNLFNVLDIDTVSKGSTDPRVVLLDTQYRMTSAIANISNTLFYEGTLKTDPSANKTIADKLTGPAALILVDTSERNPWCSKLQEGSRLNLHNAIVCCTIAQELLAEHPDLTVGLVAPYRPQARLMQKIALDWKLSNVRADTVHSFQGGEQDAIIFDCVDGPGVEYKRSMLDGEDSSLLLNVAFTRAKKKLFIVAHHDFCRKKFGKTSSIRQAVSMFESNGLVIPCKNVVETSNDSNFDSWIAQISGQTVDISGLPYVFARTQEFWPAFLADLDGAKKSVIIMSAFVAERRAALLMLRFESLLKRKVQISLHCKPPAEQPSADFAATFFSSCSKLGITVVQKAKMHEKIAIIDDQILWQGSLNILSQNKSSEHMLRLEAPQAVQDVVQKLELSKPDAIGTITDSKCTDCKSPMIVRDGRYGPFMGCTAYPGCKVIMQLSSNGKRQPKKKPSKTTR